MRLRVEEKFVRSAEGGTGFAKTSTALVGAGSIWPEHLRSCEPNEIYLRFGASDPDRTKLEPFSKAVPALILAGPGGMAVSTRGRPRVQQVVQLGADLLRRGGRPLEPRRSIPPRRVKDAAPE